MKFSVEVVVTFFGVLEIHQGGAKKLGSDESFELSKSGSIPENLRDTYCLG